MGYRQNRRSHRLGNMGAVVAVVLMATVIPAQAQQEPIRPLAAVARLDPAEIMLGRALFHDALLSRDGSLSCASCHPLDRGGSDNMVVSVGIGGAKGSVNAPTVFNAAHNIAQFWDGRTVTLEQQVDGPLQNPVEMGSDWPETIARLRRSDYAPRFRALYGADPSPELVRRALAGFERSLVATGSRFDRWLGGRGNGTGGRREERLCPVQVLWLRLVPPGRQCGRQPVPEAGFFSATGSRIAAAR